LTKSGLSRSFEKLNKPLQMKETQRFHASDRHQIVNTPLVVMVLSLCSLLVRCQVFLSIPLVPIVSQAFSVSEFSAAWVASAYSFAYAAGFLVFGPLSDRYGRKQVIVPGLLVLIPVTVAVGASRSFQVLVLLRAIQGFVGATFVQPALAYVSEVLPVPTRPVGIACMTTGLLLSGIVAQVYSSAIALNYGWRWVFWILAIAYVALLLLIITRLPQNVNQNPNSSLLSIYKSMATLLTRPSFLVVCGTGFIMFFSFVAMYSGLGAYLANQYDVDPNGIVLIRLAGAPGILLSPLSGRLIYQWGSLKVAIGGLLLAVLGLLLEPITQPLPLLVMATVIFVAGIAIAAAALLSLVTILATDVKGAAISLYSSGLFAGASLAPLVVQLIRGIEFTGLCIGLISILLASSISLHLGVRQSSAKL
jgi:MFS transporter, YNFM family, putative membrane transport protein